MRTFEIWSEGYQATGESGKAVRHGSAKGKTFNDACAALAEEDESFSKFFDPGRLTYWGCRLFDSRTKAAERFG
jgi:hypothetical protein